MAHRTIALTTELTELMCPDDLGLTMSDFGPFLRFVGVGGVSALMVEPGHVPLSDTPS